MSENQRFIVDTWSYDVASIESSSDESELSDYVLVSNPDVIEIQTVSGHSVEFGTETPNKIHPTTKWYTAPVHSMADDIEERLEQYRKSSQYNELSADNKWLIEAKFEIISSEINYLRSLLVLENQFMCSKELSDTAVISSNDKKCIYADVPAVRKCSEEFLNGLQQCFLNDPHLKGIFKFLKEFASNNFHVFIKYCSNLTCVYETHDKLKHENVKYANALARIEENPSCNRLKFNSFVNLPFNRIVKLDLPVEEALKKMSLNDEEYSDCKEAADILKVIAQECNKGAHRFESIRTTLKAVNKLIFTSEMPLFPHLSNSRLLKEGSFTHHVLVADNRTQSSQIYLLLFNNVLVISKKQGESYVVQDYSPSDMILFTKTTRLPQLPECFQCDSAEKFMMLLTILKSQTNTTTELVLSTRSESEREEWLAAVSEENDSGEVYSSWNRPTAVALVSYTASKPGELSLSQGDEVEVLTRFKNHWYEGVRLKDGMKGRFPGAHTDLVSKEHARVCSLKKLYLLFNTNED